MPFSEKEFRNALGSFATGVTIVTADIDGELLGATVSSFNSVSLAPPLVLFSLNRALASYPQWKRVKRYGVTVLGEDEADLSTRFARGGAEKWAGLDVVRTSSGVPLVTNGIARFECEIHAFHDGGDHEIVVGEVLDFETMAKPPLLFHAGQYRRLHH